MGKKNLEKKRNKKDRVNIDRQASACDKIIK